MAGQRFRQCFAQARNVRLGTLFRHDIGGQIAAARRIVSRQHNGLPYAGLCRQHRFDFAGFDAQAAQLHLRVGAAEKIDLARLVPARQIAGAIHAATRRPIWISNETLRCQAGPMQIAARQAGAGNINLAGGAVGHRVQRRIQDINPRAGNRFADRRRCALQRFAEGDAHRGFGGAIGVDHALAA